MNATVCRNTSAGNCVIVDPQNKTGTKQAQHIDQTEITMWILIAILFLATIAAGYMLWLKAGS